MDIKISYPQTDCKKLVLYKFRLVSFIVLGVGVVASGIVNLAVGGNPWFLYVLGASILYWLAFMHWPLIDNTIIVKVTEVMVAVSLYLLVVEWLTGEKFAMVVIPWIVFGLIIIQSLLYVLDKKNKRRNFMPIMWTLIASIIFVLLGICGVYSINAGMITLGSLAVVSLVLSVVIYGKDILSELRKRFHVG